VKGKKKKKKPVSSAGGKELEGAVSNLYSHEQRRGGKTFVRIRRLEKGRRKGRTAFAKLPARSGRLRVHIHRPLRNA